MKESLLDKKFMDLICSDENCSLEKLLELCKELSNQTQKIFD
jgi:hypothetical protein